MYHYYVIMGNNVYCVFIITFILLVLVLGKIKWSINFFFFFFLPDIKANLFILVVLVQDVKTLAWLPNQHKYYVLLWLFKNLKLCA